MGLYVSLWFHVVVFADLIGCISPDCLEPNEKFVCKSGLMDVCRCVRVCQSEGACQYMKVFVCPGLCKRRI